MEAPGLDFGGSGDDFCEIFARFGSGYLEAVPSVIPPTISPGILAIPQAFPPCQWTRRVTKNGQEESPSAKDTKNAKNCQESKELPLIAQNKRWVGGGDPPWGSSMESAAHRRWCRACWTINQSSSAKCQTQSQMANLKGQVHFAGLGS